MVIQMGMVIKLSKM